MSGNTKKTGNYSRNKGARGERLLVHFLQSLGIDCHRGYTFLKQSDLTGIDGVHVECKMRESLNVRKALDQAIEEAEKRKDGLPTVFWKASRKEWVTVMRTEDWAKLYKMARRGKDDPVRDDTRVHEGE